MKLLIRVGCLAALVYMQSCGGSMIKNNTADSAQKQAATPAAYKIPVPKATENLIVKDEKDLTGYWVGMFEADTSVKRVYVTERSENSYVNKINISIDEIAGDKVSGHSVVAGNIRPFTGALTKEGGIFRFAVKEPGDDKYDGAFKFSINTGDSVLSGTWKANGKIRVPARKYQLTKKLFNYIPSLKLEPIQFVDWDKKKNIPIKADDGSTYNDISYLATTEDVDKYNASADVITKVQAANLKKADLFVLRNAIYARHGYSFKKPQLRMYFDQQSWYIPVSTDVRNELTGVEKKNIALLMRYEKNAKEYYDVFGR